MLKITEECVNCGTCYNECSNGAIIEKEGSYSIDTEKCNECGTCKEVCPVGAIQEV